MRGDRALLGGGVVLLMLVSCTSTTVHKDRSPLPNIALSPAPHTCPLGVLRGSFAKSPDVISLLHDHLPTWLPAGFGLSGALSDSAGARAFWSDQTCRLVSVSLSSAGHGPGSWTVTYDKPHACGSFVMGLGECIGYSIGTSDGEVDVQTIGLTRSDADHLVHSIKT